MSTPRHLNSFPYDVNYCLDSMSELGLLTEDVSTAVMLMPRADVLRFFDETPVGPHLETHEMLHSLYLDWRNSEASPGEKAFVAAGFLTRSTLQLSDQVSELANMLASRHADATGRVPSSVRLMNYRPALQPDVLAQFVDRNTLTDPSVLDAALTPRMRGFHTRFAEAFDRTRDDIRALHTESFTALLRSLREGRLTARAAAPVTPSNIIGCAHPKRPSIDRRQVKRARKVVFKSAKLATSVLGNDIKAFISGRSSRIEGAIFDYMVSPSYRLVENAMSPDLRSVPYHLSIHAKNGAYLARGCVYFEDSPILDQIVALSLHVRDREDEIALLSATNLFAIDKRFDTDPDVQAIEGMRRYTRQDVVAGVFDELHDELQVEHNLLVETLKPACSEHLRTRLGLSADLFEVLQSPRTSLEDIILGIRPHAVLAGAMDPVPALCAPGAMR